MYVALGENAEIGRRGHIWMNYSSFPRDLPRTRGIQRVGATATQPRILGTRDWWGASVS